MDILTGISIVYPSLPIFVPIVYFYFSLFQFVKGGWTTITSLAGKSFFFVMLGILDIVSGSIMFALYSAVSFNFFWIVGAIILGKGILSLIFSFS